MKNEVASMARRKYQKFVFVLFGLQLATSHGVAEEMLTELEMRATSGGVEAGSFSEPQGSTTYFTDNIPFDTQIKNYMLSEQYVVLETNINSGKEGLAVVSTIVNAGQQWRDGSYKTRLNWPLNQNSPSNVSLSYCLPNATCGVPALGASTKSGVTFSDAVQVGKVWFHRTFDGSQATSMSEAKARALVDNDDLVYRHQTVPHPFLPGIINATNSMDAILEQCDTNQRFQFRFHAIDDVPVPSTTYFGSATYENFFVNNGLRAHVEQIDPNLEFFHVFLFRDILVDFPGSPMFAFNGVTRNNWQMIQGVKTLQQPILAINFILLDEDGSDFNLASVLTHEMMHVVAQLEEAEQEGYATTQECEFPGPASATNHIDLSQRNVMCFTERFAGRVLEPGQCAAMFNNNAQFVNDADNHLGIKDFN